MLNRAVSNSCTAPAFSAVARIVASSGCFSMGPTANNTLSSTTADTSSSSAASNSRAPVSLSSAPDASQIPAETPMLVALAAIPVKSAGISPSPGQNTTSANAAAAPSTMFGSQISAARPSCRRNLSRSLSSPIRNNSTTMPILARNGTCSFSVSLATPVMLEPIDSETPSTIKPIMLGMEIRAKAARIGTARRLTRPISRRIAAWCSPVSIIVPLPLHPEPRVERAQDRTRQKQRQRPRRLARPASVDPAAQGDSGDDRHGHGPADKAEHAQPAPCALFAALSGLLHAGGLAGNGLGLVLGIAGH